MKTKVYNSLIINKLSHLLVVLFVSISLFFACSQNQKLPILGSREFVNGDTVYHKIPDFMFTDQAGETVTNQTYKDKIYIADFFFTTCPTICPKMKTQLLRIYDKFKDNPNVGILSHSIDPKHDSVEVLKAYSKRLGVADNKMWHFVTGDSKKIFEIGEKEYMVTAKEDSTDTENGGFIHSGAFILVDKNRHIRGLYDGTKEESVLKLMKDMEILLKEK